MKIRSLSLAVVCVLGLTGSALAQRGRAFVEARGGALIPVGHFSHEDDPGGAYSIAAGYEFLPYLDGERTPDGGEVVNWGRVRRFVSAGGSWYARVLLGVGVRDLTGGFKCYRRAVLERIDLDAVHSKGYAFQIETTYRTLRAGFRVVEVPIRFADRTEGHSKMSRSIVVEAVWKVPLLKAAALAGRL